MSLLVSETKSTNLSVTLIYLYASVNGNLVLNRFWFLFFSRQRVYINSVNSYYLCLPKKRCLNLSICMLSAVQRWKGKPVWLQYGSLGVLPAALHVATSLFRPSRLCWICMAGFCELGCYKRGFCKKLTEVSPSSGGGHVGWLQDRPTIGQLWAHQW